MSPVVEPTAPPRARSVSVMVLAERRSLTIGFLVGAEMELARLEVENSELTERLETRKVVERAKGTLQRDRRQ